ncbi:MAG: hypothetical protein JXB45_01250 [Candidatus Krumholzibacteriota bacterium]|nr:hypothetical protein [Candidatus Krumholzibacteriota bacterium]
MFDISPAAIAVIIPVTFLICAVAVIITVIIINAGRKELEHKEKILALEKGIELPPAVAKKKSPRYLSMRAWGFVFTCLGIALIIGISAESGLRHGLWGLLPTSLGVGLLIAAYLEKNESGD